MGGRERGKRDTYKQLRVCFCIQTKMCVHYPFTEYLLAKGHPGTWHREDVRLMFSEQKSK